MININKFTKVAYNSIFKIIINDINSDQRKFGTGFFTKLKINNKYLYGLVTNHHVIESKHLYSGFKFTIERNGKKNIIELDDSSFKFSSEFIDVTFIELNEEFLTNILELKENDFLISCNIEYEKGRNIISIQYPSGEDLSFAGGMICSIYGINYIQTILTTEGSSGSPILDNNMSLVGIHKCNAKAKLQGVYVSEHIEEIEDKNENKNENKIGYGKYATKFSIVEYAINTRFNHWKNNNYNNINDIITKSDPKELSKNEIDELKNHGLQETQLPELFKISESKILSLNNSESTVFLFFRTNHSWYWTKSTKKKINKIIKNIIDYSKLNQEEKSNITKNISNKLNWSIIKVYEENENNVYYNKLKGEEKKIIKE
eukprot:jgi/Orpsp1_1/1179035/evm.model.c7180000067673.1